MRSGKCPKCGGTDVIASQPPDFQHGGMERVMTVTADPRWILSGRSPGHGRGQLLLLVCRTCGFAEWYVSDPQDIPIGRDYRTWRVKPPQPDAQDGQ